MYFCPICASATEAVWGPRGRIYSCTRPACPWHVPDDTYPCCACCSDPERVAWIGPCKDEHDAPCDVCDQPRHPDDTGRAVRNATGADPYGRTYPDPYGWKE